MSPFNGCYESKRFLPISPLSSITKQFARRNLLVVRGIILQAWSLACPPVRPATFLVPWLSKFDRRLVARSEINVTCHLQSMTKRKRISWRRWKIERELFRIREPRWSRVYEYIVSFSSFSYYRKFLIFAETSAISFLYAFETVRFRTLVRSYQTDPLECRRPRGTDQESRLPFTTANLLNRLK